MAPAAANVIASHLIDFGRTPKDYDKIITGDLGMVGQRILLELLLQYGYDIEDQHMDCGIEIYHNQEQDTHAGGSGCGCSAITLAGYGMDQFIHKKWNRAYRGTKYHGDDHRPGTWWAGTLGWTDHGRRYPEEDSSFLYANAYAA